MENEIVEFWMADRTVEVTGVAQNTQILSLVKSLVQRNFNKSIFNVHKFELLMEIAFP